VVAGDTAHFDEVVTQILGLPEKLRDPDVGLYQQGWNGHGAGASPGFWARASGGAIVAITEARRAIPADQPGREELLALNQAFAARRYLERFSPHEHAFHRGRLRRRGPSRNDSHGIGGAMLGVYARMILPEP
jgi:rhamnogalacturonyl hydrolase YesR